MTPRWKIRRGEDGFWRVERRYPSYAGGEPEGWYWLLVGEYRLWENAIAHTEIP